MTIAAFLLVVTGLTSLLALAVLARDGVTGLGRALGITLEVIGATVVFFVANLAVGVALVLVARAFSVFYTTLYEVADVTLLILAVIQAVVVTAWRLSSTGRRDSPRA